MSFGRFVLGAIVGGAIGATVGILLAPRSGEETRALLKEEMDQRYRDKIEPIKEKAEEKIESAKAAGRDLKEKAQSVSEDLEELGRETLDKLSGEKKKSKKKAKVTT